VAAWLAWWVGISVDRKRPEVHSKPHQSYHVQVRAVAPTVDHFHAGTVHVGSADFFQLLEPMQASSARVGARARTSSCYEDSICVSYAPGSVDVMDILKTCKIYLGYSARALELG
jgi:hypothetical protein